MNATSLDLPPTEPPCRIVRTRSGNMLRLHPAEPVDGAALGGLLASLTADDVRFRFLVSPTQPEPCPAGAVAGVDHRHTEHVLAIDEATRRPVASLLIAADPRMGIAEVAIAVASQARGQGIGWALLKHAAELARERGIRTLRSIECRATHNVVEVEQASGFRSLPLDEEPDHVLVEADLAKLSSRRG